MGRVKTNYITINLVKHTITQPNPTFLSAKYILFQHERAFTRNSTMLHAYGMVLEMVLVMVL